MFLKTWIIMYKSYDKSYDQNFMNIEISIFFLTLWKPGER